MVRDRSTTGVERQFGLDELFFSTTDARGVIRSGNEVFSRIAGYEIDELVGAPHNIIRHPDMPRLVFRILWDHLHRGEPVAAYVKNRAKDGSYYWVLALAFPTKGGFTSVRLKPSSDLLGVIDPLYRQLLAAERQAEAAEGRHAGMDAAEQELLGALTSLGFADYDDFMRRALPAEVASRHQRLGLSNLDRFLGGHGELERLRRACVDLANELAMLATQLDRYDKMAMEFLAATSFMATMAEDIGMFAMNAMLSADRNEQSAAVLRSVADLMSGGATGVGTVIGGLTEALDRSTGLLRSVAFAAAAADLEVEMLTRFLAEHELLGDEDRAGDEMRNVDVSALADAVVGNVSQLSVVLRDLDEALGVLPGWLARLERSFRELRILRVRGMVEAALAHGAAEFAGIIDDSSKLLAAGLDRSRELAWRAESLRAETRSTDRRALDVALTQLQSLGSAIAAA